MAPRLSVGPGVAEKAMAVLTSEQVCLRRP